MEIDIFVEDQTLPLSAIEESLGEHPVITGNQLLYRITPKWGGPAASSLELEIAVLIIANQLLHHVGSDIYELAKQGIISLYQHIRPHPGGARAYVDAPLALSIEDFYDSVSLRFCFPPDLKEGELAELWNDVEQNWERLSEEWRDSLEERSAETPPVYSVNLVFDRETRSWVVGDDQFVEDL